MPEGGRRIAIEDLAALLPAALRAPRVVSRRVGFAYRASLTPICTAVPRMESNSCSSFLVRRDGGAAAAAG